MRKLLFYGLLDSVIGALLGYGFVCWAGEILSIGLTVFCSAVGAIWVLASLVLVLLGDCHWQTAVRVLVLLTACAAGSAYWWLPNALF